jgi:hypothetical protein
MNEKKKRTIILACRGRSEKSPVKSPRDIDVSK